MSVGLNHVVLNFLFLSSLDINITTELIPIMFYND